MADSTNRTRKRMVVEEVGQVSDKAATDTQEVVSSSAPLEEVVKEKVEELQSITEHISDDVQKSAEVQQEIVKATQPSDSAPPKESSGTNPLIIIIPGVLLLGALLGGIVFYQRSVSQIPTETATPVETPVTSTSPSATPTPSAKLDLTKYTVVIFNGSGISGEAGKVKTLITAAGFKVGTTGNASTYDFTKTIVKAKSTVDAAFTARLIETLGKNYIVDNPQVLDTTSKNDVEVTVGTSKAI